MGASQETVLHDPSLRYYISANKSCRKMEQKLKINLYL